MRSNTRAPARTGRRPRRGRCTRARRSPRVALAGPLARRRREHVEASAEHGRCPARARGPQQTSVRRPSESAAKSRKTAQGRHFRRYRRLPPRRGSSCCRRRPRFLKICGAQVADGVGARHLLADHEGLTLRSRRLRPPGSCHISCGEEVLRGFFRWIRQSGGALVPACLMIPSISDFTHGCVGWQDWRMRESTWIA